MANYNPEKRTWRGRSYKRGGERVSDLRDAQIVASVRLSKKHACPDCGQPYEEENMTQQCDDKGNPEWVCDPCSNLRDRDSSPENQYH